MNRPLHRPLLRPLDRSSPFPGAFVIRSMLGAAVLFLAPSLGASPAGQLSENPAPRATGREIDLRPKFKAGSELKYVMTLENDGSTEMPPLEPLKQTSRQQIEFRLKTVSTDPEKGSTVELIYDAIKIQLEAGDSKLDFDSRKPGGTAPPAKKTSQRGRQPAAAGDPSDAEDATASLVEALKPIVGAKLTLTVAPDGTITQVTGGQELSGALVGKYAGPITDPQGVKDLFGPIFSLRNAKATARMGEKWQNVDKIDLALLGRLRLTTDYTLKSVSGSRATVDFRGGIDLDTEGGLENQAFKLTDTRYEGSYIWDTEAGALETMDQVQAFTLGGEMEGTVVKIHNNGKVKIERQRR